MPIEVVSGSVGVDAKAEMVRVEYYELLLGERGGENRRDWDDNPPTPSHRPGPNRPRYVALRVWLALHHSLRYPPPHPMLA
jgi:hypothetical protein